MKLTLGRMREGKTYAAASELGPGKVLILDRQDDLGRCVIEQNLWRADQMFVDDGRTNRTCKTINVWESAAATEIRRREEDKANRHDLIEAMTAGRNLNEWENVLIYERAEEAAGLLQYQREFKPVWWLSEICKWNSREANELLLGCRDHEYKEAFRGWLLMNAFQFRNEVGPAKRLLSILSEPPIMARCGTVDLFDIFDAYDVNVVMCRGLSDAAATFLIHWYLHGAIQYVERYHIPVEVVCDESEKLGAPGIGVYTSRLLRAIKMEEKHGFLFHGIMQTGKALKPEIFADLLDMASEVNCFALGDPDSIEYMAKVMGVPNYDPLKIQYVEERMREMSDGYDEIKIREEFDRPDTMLKGVRERTQLIPRKKPWIDEIKHYKSGADQDRDFQQELATLGKRERFVKYGRSAWKEKTKTLENPYLWPEVSAKRVDEFLEAMVWRPEFTETVVQKPTASAFGRPSGKKST